ncbi:hypothetical protein EDF88_4299 [Buttiauxella sp. BIGb0552]|uniref:hypothetical protein n=1 Tax=Buttiauxella sp. BIGb0552 TaxID=2485120 RepID=UPI0010E12E05|nr:hypothetical protein [Buttiauxella sp. BIGb0552]TDX13018.1 hypothetical protein EDF88_4299 [Buttiauxella sp. BIGb0552]
MKWIKKFSKDFENDKLRISYSRLNWNYLKPSIKETLDILSEKLNKNGIDTFTHDYSDDGKVIGFDGLNLQFSNSFTGNVRIAEAEDKLNNLHTQKGGVLAITYNATGSINIMILPSKSEDSLAKHTHIILHYTYNARTITPKRIEKCVKAFIHYHRYTGVLHQSTLADNLVVRWLKIRMYWIQYLNPNEKFKRYSGLYIPIVSLIVAFAAAIASILSLVIALKAP